MGLESGKGNEAACRGGKLLLVKQMKEKKRKEEKKPGKITLRNPSWKIYIQCHFYFAMFNIANATIRLFFFF